MEGPTKPLEIPAPKVATLPASAPLWRRVVSYLWTHKAQLFTAASAGIAIGKAGGNILDAAYAAAKAYLGAP